MKSKKMNKLIRDYDGSDSPPFDAFGGKPIPYLGWFWRDVNFDAETMGFGVMPYLGNRFLVGFMQSNKWGYPSVEADKGQWTEIKALITAALKDPISENFRRANDAIQALV